MLVVSRCEIVACAVDCVSRVICRAMAWCRRVIKAKGPCFRRQQATALRLVRHPERSKHHGAVFAQSNFQKRTINRAFLKGKGQSPLRISHGVLMAFVANVTLRTRAIVFPSWIPSSLSLLGFARSDRVFGNLLCKSAALPPQKLQLLAKGEFMLHLAKLRLHSTRFQRMHVSLRMTHKLEVFGNLRSKSTVFSRRGNFIYFAKGEVGSG